MIFLENLSRLECRLLVFVFLLRDCFLMLGDYFGLIATQQLSTLLVTEITTQKTWEPRADGGKFAL